MTSFNLNFLLKGPISIYRHIEDSGVLFPTYSISDTRSMGIFLTKNMNLQLSKHPLGVLQFDSISDTDYWSSYRSHRLRAQSQKTAPISDASHESQAVTCTSDHNLLHRFSDLL